ncbi:MAG TPA: agmatine deiminase family protein [Streptosporangiaceae bacterium]|nr:agmatine deiminase family protein [Streptosporangiaceae bacterium]
MRMPAEWARHEACLMAWPTRVELWGKAFAEAKAEYAAVARAIARFEPVLMVARPGQGDEARQALAVHEEAAGQPDITVIELPIDDSWLRDSGPIFVQDPDGQDPDGQDPDGQGRAGVDFRFNSWGEKYLPYDKDNTVSELLLSHLGIARIPSEMILEGGAISVDGEGTLITTEQCLLHPNRNPGLTKDQIEAELKARLGVTKVIWLPYGGADDRDTDGHVDGVCVFIGPGRVLVQACDDPESADFELMAANISVLRKATDAQGRELEIIQVPQVAWATVAGELTSVGYVNFYLANGGVVVPIAGVPDVDEQALAIIRTAMPDREVVGVVAKVIAYGGGGVHCITQQVPARITQQVPARTGAAR